MVHLELTYPSVRLQTRVIMVSSYKENEIKIHTINMTPMTKHFQTLSTRAIETKLIASIEHGYEGVNDIENMFKIILEEYGLSLEHHSTLETAVKDSKLLRVLFELKNFVLENVYREVSPEVMKIKFIKFITLEMDKCEVEFLLTF